MTESELLSAVIELAQLSGWMVHHDRPARTDKGWRTAIQGNPGYPDLTLVRDGVVIFAELKSEGGRLTDGQKQWAEALNGNMVVWRPSDWHQRRILAALSPLAR